MSAPTREKGTFTGRHMLLIMLAFFSTIITVNVTMAMFATGSWTGLVVKNSYVASQQFNEKAAAAREQAALGWTERLDVAHGELRWALNDAGSKTVSLKGATAVLHRPVSGQHDLSLDLRPDGSGGLVAKVDLADGAWIVEVEADAGLARPYRSVRRIIISGGTSR
jgi:nitrogen fixation protein FixH